MEREGPVLELLMRRLAECPLDFQKQPLDEAGVGELDVAALVWDAVHELSGKIMQPTELAKFVLDRRRSKQMLSHLQVTSAAVWLLYDPWFKGRAGVAEGVTKFLMHRLPEFATHVRFEELLSDIDRREELARLVLKSFGYRPAGETPTQATERWNVLDSVERARVLQAARKAEERARKIRDEAARKAAEEAAASYGRE